MVAAKRQAGFTLLEVLVALAVLALVLGGLMQGFAGNLRAAGSAGEIIAGTLLARSLLAAGAEAAAAEPGMGWELTTAPLPEAPQADGLGLDAVSVTVALPSGRHLRFTTWRLRGSTP